jgi:two-component system cell cycle response regulator
MTAVDDLASRVRELEAMRSSFLDALASLGDAMSSSHDRGVLIGSLLRTTASFLEAPAAVFYGSVAGSERLRALDSVGIEGRVPDLKPGEGVAGAAARTHQVALWPAPVPDARHPSQSDPAPTAGEPAPPDGADTPPSAEAAPRPSDSEPTQDAATALAMPVRSGNNPFGVLAYYGRCRPRPYDRDDVAMLTALVRQAEIAIDSSFLYDEATRLSLTDGLTGLWNRRHLALRIEAELSRAVRFGEPFSVLCCDLDGFKPVNDTLGHQAGDTVLIETARRLTDATREVDIVARPGGDEFTLLLPKTGVAGALRLADKIRTAVGERPFELDATSVDVSVSIGVAAYPEHGSSGKELLAAADGALYRAKAGGRNRVEHAQGQPLGPESTSGGDQE